MQIDQVTPRINFAVELADIYSLAGKVAFIPGGYGGIGEAIAWALALRGAKVVIASNQREQGERLDKHALRPAERVVHLEERLEEDAERDGDQGRVMAAGA